MTASLYGLPLSAATPRMGQLGQLARIDSFTEDNGPARGARRLRLVTGGGLELDIHPDRALDLGQVTAYGVPLAWMSPTGIAHPGLYESGGTNFSRTFGGGLMATCGLDQYGPPNEDNGLVFGQHGRVGAIPATLTRVSVNESELLVEGVVRQASVQHEHIEMYRTIRATSRPASHDSVPLQFRLAAAVGGCADRDSVDTRDPAKIGGAA
jgi:hypothetical protein